MLTLTADLRRELKARAHALNPTVMIGSAGLSPAVLEEIDRSLKSHELLKVRILNDDRVVRETMLQEICSKLQAGAVQHIGKILVIYRPQEAPIAKPPKRHRSRSLTKKQQGNR